jgi:hypothetical protein
MWYVIFPIEFLADKAYLWPVSNRILAKHKKCDVINKQNSSINSIIIIIIIIIMQHHL